MSIHTKEGTINGGVFSSKSDDWATPMDFFEKVKEEFGEFDLDPAADPLNAKAPRFFTASDDGLSRHWLGDLVWLNPPYGRVIAKWVEKALQEFDNGNASKIVMLLPARTCTRWFWSFYERPDVEVRFIKGRLKFGDGKGSAPFPSMLVVVG